VISTLLWSDGQVEQPGTPNFDPPESGWLWVDIENEDPARIRQVCGGLGVDDDLIDEAVANDTEPMLHGRRDLAYLMLRMLDIGDDGSLEPVAVDVFLSGNFLVTIHDGRVKATATLRRRTAEGTVLPASTPAGLLAHLAMVGSRNYPIVIEALEEEIEELEAQAVQGDPKAIGMAQALRRDVVLMRRVLVPQRVIYEELAEGGLSSVDARAQRAFARVATYQGQILDSLEVARSMLGWALETHRSAVADKTNEIVRVLTVFSAILLPLALVTGIFGMNFLKLPLVEQESGFWVLIGLMAAGAMASWVYFYRRGFVGGPRLSDLPKAVGILIRGEDKAD
jgi:magnesium transporter